MKYLIFSPEGSVYTSTVKEFVNNTWINQPSKAHSEPYYAYNTYSKCWLARNRTGLWWGVSEVSVPKELRIKALVCLP